MRSPSGVTSARAKAAIAAAGAVTLIGGLAVVALPGAASAATGCQVSYTSSTWSGGFTGNISVTNLGSAITGWTLTFTLPGNEAISQPGWNATFSQSGQSVTATNASYNGSLGTGASAAFGYNGTWSGGAYPGDPSSFSLNGTQCTGQTTGTATTTAPPTTTTAPPTTTTTTAPPTTTTTTPTQPGEPTVPSTCTALPAQLANPGNELFGSSQESSPPDTSRIQSALNSCAGSGKAVELTASGGDSAFLSGPLTINSGEVLLVDAGVTLFASRNPAGYQISGGNTCGTITSSSSNGCEPFISANGSNSGVMGTQSGSGAQGIIDGRGGQDILGTSGTWWALAGSAKSGGNQNNPLLIVTKNASNFTLFHIDLINSPEYHVLFRGGSGYTVWGVRIKTPSNSRNTDGVDPENATNVVVNDSDIQDGDDCIAVKSDSGSAASHITVENTNCWGTHGLSIGSQTAGGVNSVTFQNDTLNGTDSSGITSTSDNGIRVKSDSSAGGTVTGVTYQDICMTGVKDLLVFNPNYSNGNGSAIPNFAGITLNGVRSVNSVSGATSQLDGYDSSHPLNLTLENIDLDSTSTSAQYANIGRYDSDITASGTGVTVSNISGSGSVPGCSFPSYPGL